MSIVGMTPEAFQESMQKYIASLGLPIAQTSTPNSASVTAPVPSAAPAPAAPTSSWDVNKLSYDQFSSLLGPQSGIKDYSAAYDFVGGWKDPLIQLVGAKLINNKIDPYYQELLKNPQYTDLVKQKLDANKSSFMGSDITHFGDPSKQYRYDNNQFVDITDTYNQFKDKNYQQIDPGLAYILSQQNKDALVQGFDKNYYANAMPTGYTPTSVLGYNAYEFTNPEGALQTIANTGALLDQYKGWQQLDPTYAALGKQVFGDEGIVKGADGNIYSKYGLIVGGLDENKDFIYDPTASAGGATHDAVYRSLTNPEFTVTDWNMAANDFRLNNDWSNVFKDNAQLKNHLKTLGVDLGPNATDQQWTNALWSTLNDTYDTGIDEYEAGGFTNPFFNLVEGLDYSPSDVQKHENYLNWDAASGTMGDPWGDRDGVNYDWWGSINGMVYEPGFGYRPVDQPDYFLTPAQIGQKQWDALVDKYKYQGSYDPTANVTAKQFYDYSQSPNWNPILSPTDPILIDKGDGNYETWGRFSKYVAPDFDQRYNKYWNYYGEGIDNANQFYAQDWINHAKLGESAEGHVKSYDPSKLNSDLKNATWLNVPEIGTGYAFSETNKGDYGYAPNTAHLQIKKPNSFTKMIGPLLSIASIAFPVLQPLSMAYNVGMGIKNENWGAVLGGLAGIPGVSDALGGLGQMLSSNLGIPLNIANGIVSGGLGALGSGLSGGDPLTGLLSGGLGSLAKGFIKDIPSLGSNPMVANTLGSLSSSAISQMLNNEGKINPMNLVISGLGGGLSSVNLSK